MEICYLHYEIMKIEKKEDKIEKELIGRGRMIYDPLEQLLIYNVKEDNICYTKNVDSISLIPHYLRENKLAFKDEEGNTVTIQRNFGTEDFPLSLGENSRKRR